MNQEERCNNVILELDKILENNDCGVGITDDMKLVIFPNEDPSVGILIEDDIDMGKNLN